MIGCHLACRLISKAELLLTSSVPETSKDSNKFLETGTVAGRGRTVHPDGRETNQSSLLEARRQDSLRLTGSVLSSANTVQILAARSE